MSRVPISELKKATNADKHIKAYLFSINNKIIIYKRG